MRGKFVAVLLVGMVMSEPRRVILRRYEESLQISGSALSLVGGVETLLLDEGEKFDVEYVNQLHENTIVHAHGLNPASYKTGQDGFPLVEDWLIPADRAKHVVFDINQTGTFFMHSHYGMQHAKGLALPIIIRERNFPSSLGIVHGHLNDAEDFILMLEDWCPYTMMRTSDEKCSLNSPDSALAQMKLMWTSVPKLIQASFQTCEAPVDESHVKYERHTINRKQEFQTEMSTAETYARLRLINGGSMTNYRIHCPKGSKIVQVDGNWVVPYSCDKLWISVGQRYDLLVQKSTEITLLAIAESFNRVPNMNDVAIFRALFANSTSPRTSLPLALNATGRADDELDFRLRRVQEAPMDYSGAENISIRLSGKHGYMSINGSSLIPPGPSDPDFTCVGEPRIFRLQRGKKYCFTLVNSNGDSHSFHMHGHDFVTLETSDGEIPYMHGLNSPVFRDTVLVPGGNCARRKICFEASNPGGGVWPFHCHMSFHLSAGMLLLLAYEDSVKSDTNLIDVCNHKSIQFWNKAKPYFAGGLLAMIFLFSVYLAFQRKGLNEGGRIAKGRKNSRHRKPNKPHEVFTGQKSNQSQKSREERDELITGHLPGLRSMV
ncbi:hypothetical protein GUITHDRAFT_141431 [Guillardia theta CCMP2712]|uniref:Plastocyanin-like domain-containing protein n=1 Tax=Guillardia theta (strain CCMP2712) TaxID=905079 RepID=L1J124_GUITC|nr:hypothetical protein GUITHDRAFT_141431 [Guillardia theta CCMP2712]EKX42233.1 hypothetical protein GUITHDRAFT_141431 [Guillardia theta CCMP2712]|eukprot:XP_005829213.1 hypothetical protein GUITHDRAFT_141431 [Guillardia theta CCMP2712]